MNDPFVLEREVRWRITIIVLALSAASLLFATWQVALGLILGGVGAVVYLRLLVLDVCNITQQKDPLLATRIARRAFVKRMFFAAGVLIVPFFNPWFNFAATVLGLVTIKIAIHFGELVHFLNRRHK